MEIFYIVLGSVIIYSVIHFFLLQKKGYEKRSDYEKVVTWSAIVGISLVFLNVMFG